MKLSETALVVAKVAAFWPIKEADLPAKTAAWHEVIGHLKVREALDAVAEHARRSTEWCMPAHILEIVGRVHADRLERCGDLLYANVPLERWVDDEGRPHHSARSQAAYDVEVAELVRRVKSGEWNREQVAAYRESALPLIQYDRRGVLESGRRAQLEQGA